MTDAKSPAASIAEAEGAVTTAGCLWCGKHFKPRRGGSPRMFCAPSCRAAFHTAARRWAGRAVASGCSPSPSCGVAIPQRARFSQVAKPCRPSPGGGRGAEGCPPPRHRPARTGGTVAAGDRNFRLQFASAAPMPAMLSAGFPIGATAGDQYVVQVSMLPW